MKNKTRQLTHGALIAALYVVLTHFQNILLPGSTTWAIQFRVSEAMCILAFFTPSAVWGLTAGCMLFNITYAGALPLDVPLGGLATLLATGGMYLTRNWKVLNYPLLGFLLPGLLNSLLVGWELTMYIGGGFGINSLYVAIGETAVLLTLGSALYYVFLRNKLHTRIF